MLRKARLLFNTVRFLTPVQIFYQLYYRFKPSRVLTYYTSGSYPEKILNTVILEPCGISSNSAGPDQTFTFLNLSKQFPGAVNWNYQEYGKLWNYNLQYFNYLQQQGLDDDIKKKWLKEQGLALRKGTLKLEPYPVSLRAINIIRYFSENKVQDQQITEDLYAQLNYLYHNIEYHLLGNHLLENAFALMMGGYTFNEASWVQKSKKILYGELNEQVLNDGGHFELSPMYHQIILFRVLELIDWYRCSNHADLSFLAFLKDKAATMLGWLKEITFKNGDIPHFNDSAAGIAPSSHELFDYAKKLNITGIVPGILKGSGYRKYGNDNYECITDTGEVGASYQPGHSHADCLSFILYYKQRPFLVEAGTSTYQIGPKRNYERSTCAHNTVVIGGKNQSEVWGGFRVGKRAKVTIDDEANNKLSAAHDGYLNDFGVYHSRRWKFDTTSIEITDQIGDKDGEAFLHFHPACKVEIIKDTIFVNQFAEINITGATQISCDAYEYAIGFNQYQQATKIIIAFNSRLITNIKF